MIMGRRNLPTRRETCLQDGRVQGKAQNTNQLVITTFQVFLMMTGLLSSIKEMVCVYPVKNLMGELSQDMNVEVNSW